MADIIDPKIVGKKVFFLHPHSVIQNDLIQIITGYELEVYLLKDHRKVPGLLKEFPNSILFINIDEVLSVDQWEKYIRNLINKKTMRSVQIGILSYNEDKKLAQHFLMDIGIQAGFVQLKLGLKESARIILKTLLANEAKGRRKYVRAQLTPVTEAKFNIKMDDAVYTGKIRDISSGGMACYFQKDPPNSIENYLDDIQLNLRGKIVMVSGKLAGRRKDKSINLHIILFTGYKKNDSKTRITTFVHETLQQQMEGKLKTIPIQQI